jgi:cyanophycin synthetase
LGRSALVEQYIPGADYRMLVINGKLAAASRRVPAHVVGDGVRTIEALVHRANQDPRRRAAQRGQWTQLEFDDQSDQLLAELGYQRASIPRDGEIIYLKRIANTSAGGTAVDVTDQVHPENREIAERAATTIGLDVAGVDLLVEDITQPMRAQGGVICEINTRPGIRKHLWPAEGQPRDVVGPIVDMLYPPGSRSRIPIAVVTGSGDTQGAARMLAELLSADGSTVGLAARDGVFINGKRADGGGMEGGSATRMLLLDPTVELAVLEVLPADALRYGLGYDWADACAVLNQLPIEQPGLVDALRLVVTSARSHVFLSGEQAETHLLKPSPAAHVWRVSADGGAALCAKALAACLGSQSGDIESTLASLPVTRVQ